MAALALGAVTTAGCSRRTDDASEDSLAGDAAQETSQALDGTGTADGTGEDGDRDDPGDGDGQTAAGSTGRLDDSELEALEAQLEAMESELGALALPDNDFGDIEALLD